MLGVNVLVTTKRGCTILTDASLLIGECPGLFQFIVAVFCAVTLVEPG